MKLTLSCNVEAGIERGGENVNLIAHLEVNARDDPWSEQILEFELVNFDQELDRELSCLLAETIDAHGCEEEDEEGHTCWVVPRPGDDNLDTPNEGTVYVLYDRIFTGRSEHYEMQVSLTTEEFKQKLKKLVASDKWKLERQFGTRQFTWVFSVVVACEGNAD